MGKIIFFSVALGIAINLLGFDPYKKMGMWSVYSVAIEAAIVLAFWVLKVNIGPITPWFVGILGISIGIYICNFILDLGSYIRP